jgi:4a-hydroxytetrahydrobiopterin dehydratase
MSDAASESCDLASRTCEPCRGGIPPLTAEQYAPLQAQLPPEWKVVKGHHLERSYAFPDFRTALAFVNGVGAVAEEQGHHPDLLLRWGEVRIEIWTHKIDGLHEADFILAAKCDQVRRSM